MPTGTKIAAIVLVLLLGVAGVYYMSAAPTAPNNLKSTAAKETGASSTSGSVITPPTLTLSPTVPGSATTSPVTTTSTPTPTGVTGTNGTSGANSTGLASNSADGTVRTQPPFVPSGSTPAGSGKGDNFAAPTGTGTGTASTASSATGAPKLVNGIARGPATTAATGTTTGTTTGTALPSGSLAGGPVPTGANNPNGTTSFGTATGPTATPPATASSNGERIHVIASGDTFEALAQKYLGDSTKWTLISKANPLVAADRLKIGSKIRIPANATLTTTDTNAPIGSRATTTAASSTVSSGGSIHVVSKGETPSSISRKYYGSDKYWKQILAANKGTTEKNLKVGQKLSIPAKTAVAGAEGVGRTDN